MEVASNCVGSTGGYIQGVEFAKTVSTVLVVSIKEWTCLITAKTVLEVALKEWA